MGSIPNLSDAAQLRVLYAGNPIINRAEAALRVHGEHLHVRDALRLLPSWAHAGELSERQRLAVLARFVPPPAERCARCGARIEYVTEGQAPGWFKHVEASGLNWPHGVLPEYGAALPDYRDDDVSQSGDRAPGGAL